MAERKESIQFSDLGHLKHTNIVEDEDASGVLTLGKVLDSHNKTSRPERSNQPHESGEDSTTSTRRGAQSQDNEGDEGDEGDGNEGESSQPRKRGNR